MRCRRLARGRGQRRSRKAGSEKGRGEGADRVSKLPNRPTAYPLYPAGITKPTCDPVYQRERERERESISIHSHRPLPARFPSANSSARSYLSSESRGILQLFLCLQFRHRDTGVVTKIIAISDFFANTIREEEAEFVFFKFPAKHVEIREV